MTFDVLAEALILLSMVALPGRPLMLKKIPALNLNAEMSPRARHQELKPPNSANEQGMRLFVTFKAGASGQVMLLSSGESLQGLPCFFKVWGTCDSQCSLDVSVREKHMF